MPPYPPRPDLERLTELCASVRDVFGAHSCVCALVGDDGDLEFVAGDGEGVALVLGVRLRVGEGLAGYVVQSGLPLEVPDVRNDPRWQPALRVHDAYVPRSFVGAPLVDAHGEVVGVLNVLDPSAEVLAEAQAGSGGLLPVLRVVAAEVARVLADPISASS